MNLKKNDNLNYNIVRFGNVIDSSGSVIPLFRKQLIDGGPLTVTSKNITRYFMTISEAAQLVIQAGAMKGKGNIFVLDMGTPIKIIDLAKKMIELNSHNSNNPNYGSNNIEIKIIGLRPGEKEYEELYYDKVDKTIHERILKESYFIKKNFDFSLLINSLYSSVKNNDFQKCRKLIFDSINEL